MSHKTKPKRNKKYTPKNIRNSFGRCHAAFGPIIDWFEVQRANFETLVDEQGDACIMTSNRKISKTWEAIEAMLDLVEMGITKGLFNIDTTDLQAVRKSLIHGSLVSQTVFDRAETQLLAARRVVFALPAKVQIDLAEATQTKQLIEASVAKREAA